MSQSTFAIPNQSGANYRVAVNNALQALASLYSGTTPSESYAYQLWFDTSTNILKQRNASNNAWIDLWAATLSSPAVIDFRDTRLEAHGSGNISSNTAVGMSALNSNTTGVNNTAVGQAALSSNTTGTSNTAVGWQALFSNNTGTSNTAVGLDALYSNNTGVNNTAVGLGALYSNNTGVNNTAVGQAALYSNNTGVNNTAVGMSALYSNNTGVNNTAVGQAALSSNTTGVNNTAIGINAGNSVFVVTTQSNNVVLGDGSVTSLRCNVTSITALSDERDKTNITDIPFDATSFLNKLKPRKFEWNMRPKLGTKVGQKEIGFIAQEVEAVLQQENIEIPQLLDIWVNHYPDDENGETELEIKSLAQGTLIPVLVKAIQELSQRLNALEA